MIGFSDYFRMVIRSCMLQENNISHWKRKKSSTQKMPAGMGYVSSQEGNYNLKLTLSIAQRPQQPQQLLKVEMEC